MKRRVAAELEDEALHGGGGLAAEQAPDLGRAGEAEDADAPVVAGPRTIGGASPVTTLRTPAGMPARSASSASARAENGVWLRVDDDGAAGGQGRGGLAGDHGGGEIPGGDQCGDAGGLAPHDLRAVR